MEEKLQQSSYQTLLELTRLPKFILDNDPPLFPDDVDYDSFVRLREIKENIYDRVFSNDKEKHLLICSNCTGNGKTSWAVKILKEYCMQDSHKEYHPFPGEYDKAVFISTTEYVLNSKEYNEHRGDYFAMKDDIEKSALVIFDDIGSAEYTRAEYVALLAAVDKRIFENKMCIFTSNFTQKNESAIKRLGQRLADRVFDTSEIIELKGNGVRN